MQSSLRNPARFEVIFDDDHAVANAGLALVAMCSTALGIEDAANEYVDLGDRPGASRPGRKILTLLHSMVVGGDCIDDVDVLRCGSTDQVLGHRVNGALHSRHVPTLVHLRSRPPTRPSLCHDSSKGVDGWCRPRRRGDDPRSGFNDL